VGRDRRRNYFGGPLSNNSVREQLFLTCAPEWVTPLPLPPEEGGRSSLLNVAGFLASEMDMSCLPVTSITKKHHSPKYLSLKIHFTHEEWTALLIP
jgi:hypothetical protein